MSRKRVYEEPFQTPGMGTIPPLSAAQFYEDSPIYSEPSGPKRPTHGYVDNFQYKDQYQIGDSWTKNRYDQYNSFQSNASSRMEFERYEGNPNATAGAAQNLRAAAAAQRDQNLYAGFSRKLTMDIPMPTLPKHDTESKFGLGLDKYGHEQPGPLMTEFQDILSELQEELAFLRRHPEVSCRIPNTMKILEKEAHKLEHCVEPEWLEVDINKPINIYKRIVIPTTRNPNFNFVGKILGSKGQTLHNLAKVFKCQVILLGEGSCRDTKKESQLFNSGNPKYYHYGLPLFIQASTIARPHVAYHRMANFLNCLHKLFIPSHDIHIPGITDGNLWFESGETVICEPVLFDEAEDENKEHELRSRFGQSNSVPVRNKNKPVKQPTKTESSTKNSAVEDISSHDSSKEFDKEKNKVKIEAKNINGTEFRTTSISNKPSTSFRGRGRGRGAIPIRRF